MRYGKDILGTELFYLNQSACLYWAPVIYGVSLDPETLEPHLLKIPENEILLTDFSHLLIKGHYLQSLSHSRSFSEYNQPRYTSHGIFYFPGHASSVVPICMYCMHFHLSFSGLSDAVHNKPWVLCQTQTILIPSLMTSWKTRMLFTLLLFTFLWSFPLESDLHLQKFI